MTARSPDRRSLLWSGVALGAAASLGVRHGASLAAAGAEASLAVRVTLDGKTYQFDEARGRDLGDYRGSGFVQRCIMVTTPDLPLSVFMRPDRDSSRVEVVFELGRVWSGPPRHLGPYRAEIARGGQVLAQIDVPEHYWFSRWRWQSARRPVIAKATDLIAASLLPPYAIGTAAGARIPPGEWRPYSIMGLAGLTAYMPTTGDRAEIGPVTEPQARWICTGARDAFEGMFAQAEASGTVPWNIRDERTGAPFSFAQYPNGGWNSDAPRIFHPFVKQLKSPVTPDPAHHPALTYVPFILTGDPYYLEALQLQLTWCLGFVGPEYRSHGACILPHGQTRSYAWCLRDASQLVRVTPDSVPSWLLPRSYWAQIFENNRHWFESAFVHNPAPPFRVFRAATKIRTGTDDPGAIGKFKIPRVDPWEEDYLAIVMGWTASMFPAWRDAFAWKVGATIARTDGTSGWQRAYASPYLFALAGPPPASWAETWKEAWQINVELQNWNVTDPNRFSERNTGYLHYARAALAIAARQRISGARECYSWADGVIRNSNRMPMMYRWRLAA